MVCHHGESVHSSVLYQVIDQPVHDGLAGNFEQRLGIVLGKRIQTGCVPRRKDKAFHIDIQTFTPSAL